MKFYPQPSGTQSHSVQQSFTGSACVTKRRGYFQHVPSPATREGSIIITLKNLFTYFLNPLFPKNVKNLSTHPLIPLSTLKKPAFTLAEVLITLGIIGVVAAMTIPALITNTQAIELQTALKKTYSELNQMSRLFLDENEEPVPSWTYRSGITAFAAEFPKYMKGITKTSDWKYNASDPENSNTTDKLPYKVYRMSGSLDVIPCDASGYLMDISGKMYLFDNTPKKGYNGPRICVDINGTKKPNILGIDIFYFLFTTDGQVIPEGQDHPDNNYEASVWRGGTVTASKNNCNSYPFLACAYYAINDKSPKDDGHRYWKDFVAKKKSIKNKYFFI